MLSVNFLHLNQLLSIAVSYKMMSYLNVFGFVVLDWILNDAYGTAIVNVYHSSHKVIPIVQ